MEALSAWEHQVFSMGFVNTLILIGVVCAVVVIVLKLLKRFFNQKFGSNMVFFNHLINALVVIIAVFAVLMTIEPLKQFAATLLASSGIVAVVVGLAAQEAFGNLFSGISIGLSHPFKVGDYIEISGQNLCGHVMEMHLRHTVIRDTDRQLIVVPNSVLNKNIIRTTPSTGGYICNHLNITISYQSDIERALGILEQCVLAHPDHMDIRTPEEKAAGKPAARARVVDFGDFGIQLRICVWTQDAIIALYALSDIRRTVKQEFDRCGIEIPYPYQNVIIREDLEKPSKESPSK